MRHYIDVFLFRIRGKEPVAGQIKEIGANDLYLADGGKFGTFQSMGTAPPFAFIVNGDRKARRLLGSVRRVTQELWKSMLQQRFYTMAAIMEDLPQHENRVLPGPGSIGRKGPVLELRYTMSAEDRRRHGEFMRLLMGSLRRYRGSRIFPIHLSGAESDGCEGDWGGRHPTQQKVPETVRDIGVSRLLLSRVATPRATDAPDPGSPTRRAPEFERQVDLDGVLPADVRAEMARHARTAYMLQLAERSRRARQLRADRTG